MNSLFGQNIRKDTEFKHDTKTEDWTKTEYDDINED